MKVCIAGAGDVGSFLAEKLAREGYECAVIDRNPVRLENLALKYNILTYECDISVENCFEQFRDFDYFLLLTDIDEVNITSALRIRELYGNPNVVLRIFNPIYAPLCRKLKFSIVDVVNSVAKNLNLLLEFPSAKGVWEIENILILALVVRPNSPLIGKKLRDFSHLREKFNYSVVLLKRGKEFLIPKGDTEILSGDILYLATERDFVSDLLKELGYREKSAKTVMVLGYSRYADFWFKTLADTGITIKFFHPELKVCERVGAKYPYIEVYQTLLTDAETLKAEGVDRADYIWCMGEEDEKNIVVGMFAKNLGAKRVGVLLKHPQYEEFVSLSEIDAYVLPKKMVAAKVYSLLKKKEVLEVVELAEGVDIYEIPYEGEEGAIRDLRLKECDFIFAIKRNGKYLIPKGNTVVKSGDLLLCLRKI